MSHRRAFLYAFLVLAVPIPALAATVGLPGGGAGADSLS
jgi:hypothetical protein